MFHIPYILMIRKRYQLKSHYLTQITVQVFLIFLSQFSGATMFLFRGYMGTILHTGDFRFHESWFDEYNVLYPYEKKNKDFTKCSIHIDELIFDNTFCDPIFRFPSRDKALGDLIEIIEKNRDKRVIISIYSLGKEEMLVALAEYFETLIIVDENRYAAIRSIEFRPELFSTNPEEGWIEINGTKAENQIKMKSGKYISIKLTGWANLETYASPDGMRYVVPYSSHSNYEEMERFVKSIHPSILKCVVRKKNTAERINNIREFTSYMVTLMHLKQRGYEMFVKHYTDPESLSNDYKLWLKPQNLEQLNFELGLKIPESGMMEANRFLFQKKYTGVIKNKKVTRIRTGAKIKDVDLNNNLTIEQMFLIKTNSNKTLKQFSNTLGSLGTGNEDSRFTNASGPQFFSENLSFDDNEDSMNIESDPIINLVNNEKGKNFLDVENEQSNDKEDLILPCNNPETQGSQEDSLLSKYIKTQIKEKGIINSIKLKNKSNYILKTNSLSFEIENSLKDISPRMEKSKSFSKNITNKSSSFEDLDPTDPEEYFKKKKQEELKTIEVLKKLQGNNLAATIPRGIQEYLQKNNLTVGEDLVMRDATAFGNLEKENYVIEDNTEPVRIEQKKSFFESKFRRNNQKESDCTTYSFDQQKKINQDFFPSFCEFERNKNFKENENGKMDIEKNQLLLIPDTDKPLKPISPQILSQNISQHSSQKVRPSIDTKLFQISQTCVQKIKEISKQNVIQKLVEKVEPVQNINVDQILKNKISIKKESINIKINEEPEIRTIDDYYDVGESNKSDEKQADSFFKTNKSKQKESKAITDIVRLEETFRKSVEDKNSRNNLVILDSSDSEQSPLDMDFIEDHKLSKKTKKKNFTDTDESNKSISSSLGDRNNLPISKSLSYDDNISEKDLKSKSQTLKSFSSFIPKCPVDNVVKDTKNLSKTSLVNEENKIAKRDTQTDSVTIDTVKNKKPDFFDYLDSFKFISKSDSKEEKKVEGKKNSYELSKSLTPIAEEKDEKLNQHNQNVYVIDSHEVDLEVAIPPHETQKAQPIAYVDFDNSHSKSPLQNITPIRKYPDEDWDQIITNDEIVFGITQENLTRRIEERSQSLFFAEMNPFSNSKTIEKNTEKVTDICEQDTKKKQANNYQELFNILNRKTKETSEQALQSPTRVIDLEDISITEEELVRKKNISKDEISEKTTPPRIEMKNSELRSKLALINKRAEEYNKSKQITINTHNEERPKSPKSSKISIRGVRNENKIMIEEMKDKKKRHEQYELYQMFKKQNENSNSNSNSEKKKNPPKLIASKSSTEKKDSEISMEKIIKQPKQSDIKAFFKSSKKDEIIKIVKEKEPPLVENTEESKFIEKPKTIAEKRKRDQTLDRHLVSYPSKISINLKQEKLDFSRSPPKKPKINLDKAANGKLDKFLEIFIESKSFEE